MKKFSWILALIAALAMVFVGCGGGGGEPEAPTEFTLVLADNYRYGHGYQGLIDALDFIKGKITKGEEFVISFTVKASRDLEDTLNFGLVDPSEAANYWTPLTWESNDDPTLAGPEQKPFMVKDQEYEVKDIEWTALVSATAATKDANKIVFMTSGKSKDDACDDNCDWKDPHQDSAVGDGKEGPVTLTFTNFSFKRAGDVIVEQPDPPLTGPLSLTDFSDAKKTGGYGVTNTSGNTWEINDNYQQVKFSLGGDVTSANYKSVTITYSTDVVATVSFLNAEGVVKAIEAPGSYQGKCDLAVANTSLKIDIPADVTFHTIAFESKDQGKVTLTITKVEFEVK